MVGNRGGRLFSLPGTEAIAETDRLSTIFRSSSSSTTYQPSLSSTHPVEQASILRPLNEQERNSSTEQADQRSVIGSQLNLLTQPTRAIDPYQENSEFPEHWPDSALVDEHRSRSRHHQHLIGPSPLGSRPPSVAMRELEDDGEEQTHNISENILQHVSEQQDSNNDTHTNSTSSLAERSQVIHSMSEVASFSSTAMILPSFSHSIATNRRMQSMSPPPLISQNLASNQSTTPRMNDYESARDLPYSARPTAHIQSTPGCEFNNIADHELQHSDNVRLCYNNISNTTYSTHINNSNEHGQGMTTLVHPNSSLENNIDQVIISSQQMLRDQAEMDTVSSASTPQSTCPINNDTQQRSSTSQLHHSHLDHRFSNHEDDDSDSQTANDTCLNSSEISPFQTHLYRQRRGRQRHVNSGGQTESTARLLLTIARPRSEEELMSVSGS